MTRDAWLWLRQWIGPSMDWRTFWMPPEWSLVPFWLTIVMEQPFLSNGEGKRLCWAL